MAVRYGESERWQLTTESDVGKGNQTTNLASDSLVPILR
jgi:hypothetical protein